MLKDSVLTPVIKSKSWALSLLFAGLLSFPLHGGNPILGSSCGRLVYSAATSFWTDAEYFLFWIPDMSLGDIDRSIRREGYIPMPSTRRGVITYLNHLHLYGYDFRNKKVLDVGAGKSRFVQRINQIYGSSGTIAKAVDRQAKYSPDQDTYLTCDAKDLPFEDNEFDLVVSNWVLNNSGDDEARALLREMIRVAGPGGEVRLFQTFKEDELWGPLLEYAQNHPKVSSIRKHWRIISGTIVLEIKD